MDCRPGCGACCVAPSISSPLPGMPRGKPAGVRCVNLDAHNLRRVGNTPAFPAVCRGFRPESAVCGGSAAEALVKLTILEAQTRTAAG